jgi:hypothetical protein
MKLTLVERCISAPLARHAGSGPRRRSLESHMVTGCRLPTRADPSWRGAHRRVAGNSRAANRRSRTGGRSRRGGIAPIGGIPVGGSETARRPTRVDPARPGSPGVARGRHRSSPRYRFPAVEFHKPILGYEVDAWVIGTPQWVAATIRGAISRWSGDRPDPIRAATPSPSPPSAAPIRRMVHEPPRTSEVRCRSTVTRARARGRSRFRSGPRRTARRSRAC